MSLSLRRTRMSVKAKTEPVLTFAEDTIVGLFGLESGSCLDGFLCSTILMSRFDNFTCREDFGLFRVYIIHSIMGHCACSVYATPGV